MLVVRVELHSAVTGEVTEIAAIDIANVGACEAPTHKARRNFDYRVRTYPVAGRDDRGLPSPQKWGFVSDKRPTGTHFVRDHDPAQNVWDLVAKALTVARTPSSTG